MAFRGITGTIGTPGPEIQPVLLAPGKRDYALDAARAVLMVFGVVLHSATAYSRNGEWVVRDPSGIPFFDMLVQSIHLFRMPAFFWISGYFYALTMSRRSPGVALRRRLTRLAVPLAVTWLTLNVLQEWGTALATHSDPVEAVGDGIGIWHLWFLLDLVIMTLVAAAVMPITVPAAGGLIERTLARLTVPRLLLGLTLFSAVTFLFARASGVAYVQVAGVTTLGRLATYFPFFAGGIVMYRRPEVRRVFLTVPPWLMLLALPVGVYAQSFRKELGLMAELAAPTENLMVWICIAVVLQGFYRLVSRESRAVQLLNDSSYSIYLFHHSIMVFLVFLFLPVPLGAVVKFLVVASITFTAAVMLHVVVVRRSRLLHFLFNGVAPRRAATPARRPDRAGGPELAVDLAAPEPAAPRADREAHLVNKS